jgi:hypothetical protein
MGKLIRIIGKTMKGVTTITAYYEDGTQETIIKGRWSRVGVHIVKRPGGLPEIDGTLEIGRRAA